MRLDAAARERLRRSLYASAEIRRRLDRVPEELSPLEALAFAEHPPSRPGVLVCGAGLGREAIALARRGAIVRAVETDPDLAAELTRRAKALALPIETMAEDARDAAVPPESFGAVTVFSFLASMLTPAAERARLFAAVRAALAPGGRAYFTVLVAADPADAGGGRDRWNLNETVHVFGSLADVRRELEPHGLHGIYEKTDRELRGDARGFVPALLIAERA